MTPYDEAGKHLAKAQHIMDVTTRFESELARHVGSPPDSLTWERGAIKATWADGLMLACNMQRVYWGRCRGKQQVARDLVQLLQALNA